MASSAVLAVPPLTLASVRARLFSLGRLDRELATTLFLDLLYELETASLEIPDDLAADLDTAGEALGF